MRNKKITRIKKLTHIRKFMLIYQIA